MWKILLVACLVLFHLIAQSQEAVSLSYSYGDIAVHTPLIEPLITGPVHGFSINYAFANYSGSEWRRLYNYPDYGLSYTYKDYSNPEHLGTSHSVTGFFQIPFLRIGHVFNAGFKGITGLGVFTKKYNVLNNAENKAISSTLNITAETRLYSKINIHPVFLEYSFGLNHFSNGLIKAPNLGINVFSNSFTMGYYFEEEAAPPKTGILQTERKESYEIWAVSSLGVKEMDGNPQKYLYSGVTVNFAVFLSQINKLGIGIDVHNDPSLMSYASGSDLYSRNPRFYFRYGINLNHEFIFGNTGFFAGYGYYLKDTGYNPSMRYYKVGFKYYYKKLIGMVLIRAVPLFRADVVEFGFGYKFTKYRHQDS